MSTSESCILPTPTNLQEAENKINDKIRSEGIFNENETKTLAKLLIGEINKQRGGGCDDENQRHSARIFMISLSGLLTFIIQEVISLIKMFRENDEIIKSDSAFKNVVKNNYTPTAFKAQIISYLWSTKAGVEELSPSEKNKYYLNKSKTNVFESKVSNLLISSFDILKSVGVFCFTLIISLISTRGLEFDMENVKAITEEIINNIYNNMGELISLSAEKISEGYINYVEGKESTLSTILIPVENWICNWLYKSSGGQNVKKRRRTNNNKRKHSITKRRTYNNKNKKKYLTKR